MASAAFLRKVRTLHLYFGVLISPAILFFAFTGALQTFSLHETTRGSDYQPPHWAVVLAQIHKKQTAVLPVRRPAPPQAAQHDGAPRPAATTPAFSIAQPKRHPLPLRIFFLLVSIGLFSSTLTGLYMAWTFHRNLRLISGLLLAGVVVPILLLYV